ncbi:MAG: LysM peptidoglycan-binding domain-containing M23 family metallopeptidase [Treponemataceae bacterium]|nr:LysM peptidoglycan-binding domain-containing M23 family metallopeptidase [Treponemataceae bacterium]
MKRFIFVSLFLTFLFPLYSLTHTVQPKDTFYSISKKYGVEVGELCKANGLTTNSIIKPGDVLKIPGKPEVNTVVETYIVQPGETVYSLSRKFGVTQETLQVLNNMEGKIDIKAGQKIYVPVAKSDVKNTDKTAASSAGSSSSASSSSSAGSSSSAAKASGATSSAIKTAVTTPSKVEPIEELRLTDSRTYDKSKTANKNLKWPVSPKEIRYVTGKVSGVAITANENESVKSIVDGKVMFCGVYRGFGNVVFVENKSGYMYVYSNLSKISVEEGDSVSVNQQLGNVCLDTRSGKPQLMFMVFKNGDPIDPSKAPRG